MLLNAQKIFNLETGTYTLAQIKGKYRILARENHPDFGGSTEAMQLINNAYEELLKYFANHETYTVFEQQDAVNMEFMPILKKMHGVKIEIVGYWVWLTGNTIEHKDAIKQLKFKFSGSKKAWYWSPTIGEGYRRGTASLSTIRKTYGSTVVETEPKHYQTLN